MYWFGPYHVLWWKETALYIMWIRKRRVYLLLISRHLLSEHSDKHMVTRIRIVTNLFSFMRIDPKDAAIRGTSRVIFPKAILMQLHFGSRVTLLLSFKFLTMMLVQLGPEEVKRFLENIYLSPYQISQIFWQIIEWRWRPSFPKYCFKWFTVLMG